MAELRYYFDENDPNDRHRLEWIRSAGHKQGKLLRAMIDYVQALLPDVSGADVDHIIFCLQRGISLNNGRAAPAPVITTTTAKERKPRKPKEKTPKKEPPQQPAQTDTRVAAPMAEKIPAAETAPQEKAAPMTTTSSRGMSEVEANQKLWDALGID